MALRARATNLERTYTPEEFEASAEFNERYELVDGRPVKKPMPGEEHGWIARIINKQVTLHDPEDKLGVMWFDTSFDVGTGWMPIPDLAYTVATKTPTKRSAKSFKGIPDLVVEIHSPTDLRSKAEREATEKKIKNWQAVGVSIIWAINPEKKVVRVYHRDEPKPVMELGIDDQLDGENIIPSFKLKIRELFS